MPRPTVTVIVPFAGTDGELERCRAVMETLGAEQLLIHDNRAPGEPRSSYFARQQAARRATGEWLVFLDADTEPEAGLLDAYFDPAPDAATAILAGGIVDHVDDDTLVARYVADRRKLDQANTVRGPRPYAQTANAAIRRDAFEAVGGFDQPVRSGGDADLCWRLQAAGYGLEVRPHARVRHRNRARLRDLLGQIHRHGSGMHWLDQRWPGAFPPPTPRELLGRFKLVTGTYGALDFLTLWARDLGRLHANGDPS